MKPVRFAGPLLILSLWTTTLIAQVVIKERVILNPQHPATPTHTLLAEPTFSVDSTYYSDLKMILAMTDQPLKIDFSITASLDGTAFPHGGWFYVQDAPWRTLSPVRYQFSLGPGGRGTFTGSFTREVYYDLVGLVFNSPPGIYNATSVTVNAIGDTATISFDINERGYTAISAKFTMTLPPTAKTIKLSATESTLLPLGDNGNKDNPDYSKTGPDKRKKIIDFSKVKTTTVKVTVKDQQNSPVPNYSFTLRALVRSNSGGHDHDTDRPTGRFITHQGDTLATFQDVTDANGDAQYTYLSSGIGGVDSLFVQGATATDTASATIELKIPNLELLGSGAHYVLIGAFGEPGVRSKHLVNHYGTSILVNKLKELADSVYSEKIQTIRINDMSITWGGPFDTENNWNTPHEKHREGRSVDISDTDISDTRINEEYLRNRITHRPLSGRFSYERTLRHFHLTF